MANQTDALNAIANVSSQLSTLSTEVQALVAKGGTEDTQPIIDAVSGLGSQVTAIQAEVTAANPPA